MPTIYDTKTGTSGERRTISLMNTSAHKSDTIIPLHSLFFLAVALILSLLVLPEKSHAARAINSITLDGASSITVAPSATITAVANVTTTGSGGNNDWRSIGWRIAATTGTMNCVNFEPDHTSAGTYLETFPITAPTAEGTYNAYFIAYSDDNCSNNASSTYTMPSSVIIVDTPPTASSINRINPTPTALTNVSWTVTFNEAVTGVDASDFALIQAGGVSGAIITSVTGSGSTWTVSASTGNGNGTLGLNLVDNDSILDATGNPLGGNGSGNGNFTGQVYTVDKTCFTDNFDGTINPNWSVGRQGGTYTPQITNSRLRLTDTSANAATWATLQRIFPAADNKVTAEFDHYAYGGSGADGIAVILSNAAIPPVAGAFGGSMGYAQKGQTPVSDCTATGGCPGFAGGWMGIALDEYGNYSTNTEGRVGGFTAAVPNSVAIRGSGSGMSGYRYLVGTGSLTPAINNTSTADHYRITIDHTDNIHAWVSVERDPTGGTSYTTLLGCAPGQTSGCTPLDVLDAGYSQDPVPANWYLSFTGASGGSTNIHEFDSLKVCTSQGQVVPTLDHIRLIHDDQACTGSSNPASITVKACADATCSSLYLDSVTVNLSSTGIAGATWSSNPVTFSGGQTTVILTSNAAGTVTLGGTATSPTASNATRCFSGATETCSLIFGSCVFDAVETGTSAFTPIYAKLSGTAFNLDVLSLIGSRQTITRVEIVDAGSGTCSTYVHLADSTTAVPSVFTAHQRKSFGFNYGGATRNARIRVTYATSQYSCSSDNFAIRPTSFAVTSNATQTGSSGTPVFRAGQDTFSLIATALPGYDGRPKLNAAFVSSTLPNIGLFGAVTFPNAIKATGVATGTGFTYSEVGNFSLGQYAVYDDGFTAVDSNKTPPECTSDFNNGPVVNGRYGCMFGSSTAGPFGRFVPHHFTVIGAVANACPAGSFTYMGQPFSLSRAGDITKAEVVEARNAGEAVTKNYAVPYAPGTVSFGAENANNGTDLSARLAFYSAATYPALSGSWVSGVYTLTGNDTAVAFKRPTATTPDATWGSFDALDLGLTVVDSDVTTLPLVSGADMNPATTGATSLTYKKFSGTPLRMRYGRIVLQNAYGPETAPIKMRLLTQYYNGTAFIANPDDTCSKYSATNLACSNLIGPVTCTDVTTSGVDITNGQYFTLSAPMKTGTLLYTLTVDSCLQYEWDNLTPPDYNENPTGRANFGIYRGNDRIINWREIIR